MKWYVRRYGLEATLLFFTTIRVFPDAGIALPRYFILAAGILIALVSAILKAKDDGVLERVLDVVQDSGSTTADIHRLLTERQAVTDEENIRLKEQNELISRLVQEGLISDSRIFEIVQRNRFYFLFCYQNIPDLTQVHQILQPPPRTPALEAAEEIGFIKLGKHSNFYVVAEDALPKKIRTQDRVESTFRSLVRDRWQDLLNRIKVANPVFHGQYLEKNNGDPTNTSYVIFVANLQDVVMDHIGYNAFSKQFKMLLNGRVETKKLRKEIAKRKHQIREFLQRTSLDLLISDIKVRKDRIKILAAEEKIRTALDIHGIGDYYGVEIANLEHELLDIVGQAKARRYAQEISAKSKSYSDLFRVLGIGSV